MGGIALARDAKTEMKAGTAQKISNAILSCAAGFASFLFSLGALLYLREFDEKILAALAAGAFCLLISYVAGERPNSESARALAALGDRLLAVEEGDLMSPAPDLVRRNMPKLAQAVDTFIRGGSGVDRECARARHVRSRDLASKPPAFPFGGRQAAL